MLQLQDGGISHPFIAGLVTFRCPLGRKNGLGQERGEEKEEKTITGLHPLITVARSLSRSMQIWVEASGLHIPSRRRVGEGRNTHLWRHRRPRDPARFLRSPLHLPFKKSPGVHARNWAYAARAASKSPTLQSSRMEREGRKQSYRVRSGRIERKVSRLRKWCL